MSDRVIRRHHWEQVKRRARGFACFESFAPGPRTLGRKAATPKSCSCWMCGNPRRYSGDVTRQEQLADRPTEIEGY